MPVFTAPAGVRVARGRHSGRGSLLRAWRWPASPRRRDAPTAPRPHALATRARTRWRRARPRTRPSATALGCAAGYGSRGQLLRPLVAADREQRRIADGLPDRLLPLADVVVVIESDHGVAVADQNNRTVARSAAALGLRFARVRPTRHLPAHARAMRARPTRGPTCGSGHA